MTDFPDPAHAGGEAIVPIARDAMAPLRLQCAAHHVACIDIDLSGNPDKTLLLERIARAVEYPDMQGFGRNWDALEDLLNDLSWLHARGYALLVHARAFDDHAHPQDIAMLSDILSSTSARWAEDAIAFRTYVVRGDA